MNIVNVKINPLKETSYPILIGEGLLDDVYLHIKKYTDAKKFLVVTNDTVFALYGEKLKSDFSFR